MSTRLPEIGLGDLIKALEQIQPGAQAERDQLPNVWVFRPAIFPIRCRITDRLKELGIPHTKIVRQPDLSLCHRLPISP